MTTDDALGSKKTTEITKKILYEGSEDLIDLWMRKKVGIMKKKMMKQLYKDIVGKGADKMVKEVTKAMEKAAEKAIKKAQKEFAANQAQTGGKKSLQFFIEKNLKKELKERSLPELRDGIIDSVSEQAAKK